MAPAYKLTYFNIKGLAEVSRFLLKYGNIDYEDDRVEMSQWPELKPSMPFGQMPVLTIDGKRYHQSLAIARMLAKRVKLTGEDEIEDLEIDSAVYTVEDLRQKISVHYYEQDAAKKEAHRQKLFDETLPYYLPRLNKIAEENDGHLACKKLTWADMYFVSLSMDGRLDADVIKKYPGLKAVERNVLEIPAIKKYVETRPKDAF